MVQFKKLFSHSQTGNFKVHLVDEDNVLRWIVQMSHFPDPHLKDSLAHDMKALGVDYVTLEILFHGQHPIKPPFVRVVSPHFKSQTGHVLMNGAVCSDFFTSQSWNPSYDMEQVLVTIQSLLVEGKGRLESAKASYALFDSFSDFDRMLSTHNWHQ
jgi:ubiquitin-conjugating enzyme E2 Q